MSQDSNIIEDLDREIRESQTAIDNLLAYSRETNPLILPENMTFQQVVNTPIPSSPSEFWTPEQLKTLTENQSYFEEMVAFVKELKRSGPAKKKCYLKHRNAN